MTTIANIEKVQEVLALAWIDESLKNKLLNNPKSIFVEYGLEFPSFVEVQVHENTSNLINYVLPQANEIPEGIDIEEIEPLAGQVIKLALTNETFKTLLLSEPKSAIAEATSLTLPTSLEIRVYEDTPTVKHLVLPVNPASEELSDLELEAIAGGGAKPFGVESAPSETLRPYTAPQPVSAIDRQQGAFVKQSQQERGLRINL